MNPELEKLIDLALADGVLTDKEKQILFKKAEVAGIDLDEFEMVLEGRLHLLQKQDTTSKQKDNVTKCPSCGEIVSGLGKVCSSCGFVFANQNNSKLDDSIHTLENLLIELKSFPKPNAYKIIKSILLIYFTMGIYVLYKKLYKKEHLFSSNNNDFEQTIAKTDKQIRIIKNSYGENQKVKKLIEEITIEKDSVIHQRKKAKLRAMLITIGIFVALPVLLVVLDDKSIESKKENKAQSQFLIEQELSKNNFEEAKKMALKLKVEEGTRAEIYKAETLFHLKNKDFQKAEAVFFSCPKDIYYHFRSVASHIVQAYLDNNDKKGATSFVNKIDVVYDGGKQQDKLKELLK